MTTTHVPVTIAIEPDGFLQVFGPPQVDVRIIDLLDIDPESRTDAEDYATLQLPRPHRQFAFDARHGRGVHMPGRRTVEGELNRKIIVALVKELTK
jgi:hypothetical protein